MSIFSTLLLEARKAAGYASQESFAKVLQIPQQTYGNYESGRSFPKEDTLRQIGVTLGVSVDTLLGMQPSPSRSDHDNLNAKISRLRINAEESASSIERLLESIRKLEGAL